MEKTIWYVALPMVDEAGMGDLDYVPCSCFFLEEHHADALCEKLNREVDSGLRVVRYRYTVCSGNLFCEEPLGTLE
jgi:hypothetical protein